MATFVALMLVGPGGEQEQEAADLQLRVRSALGDDAPVRIHQPRDLHLTLHFAGAVEPGLRTLLAKALELACADAGACDLALGATGTFPGPHAPRVLWARVEERGPPRLEALQRAIAGACASLGLLGDPKPWLPHVTLARLLRAPLGLRRPTWRLPKGFLGLDPRFSWKPSHAALVESLPGRSKAHYRVVAHLPLEAGAPPPSAETGRSRLDPPAGDP